MMDCENGDGDGDGGGNCENGDGNRGVHPKNEDFEMMTYCCKNCSWMK
jgi:hypothetical protein